MFEDIQIKRYINVHFLREYSTDRPTADFRLNGSSGTIWLNRYKRERQTGVKVVNKVAGARREKTVTN